MATTASPVPGDARLTSPESAAQPYASPDPLERVWADPPGFIGALCALQNDTVGKRIIGTALGFFVLGGLNAALMRVQLARAENTFLSPDVYNQLMTMHGSTMMFLFAVPLLEGIAILVLPFVLGSREMPFPRLGVFSFWTFLFGGLLFYSSFLFGAVPDTGWFAYMPLSGTRFSPGLALDFWLLALGVSEIAAIAAGVEIIISIMKMRAPGMRISRMPLFAWAMLVTAFMLLFAFVPLLVGTLLMELDRMLNTQFYEALGGGSPLLWQHIFWIFGHPEVYIQFLPAVGMVSMIIPVFARRRIVGYPLLAMGMVATGFISFGLWVHHMFTAGLPQVAMTFFTAASLLIAIPSGVQIFAWITTLWTGRPVFRTPLLFALGFIILFVLGGITGVMVASVPFDWQVHDSFFVVAHFHYVLIGGVTFPMFAAFYYWAPKFFGRLLDERLGRWNFWLMFIGFNVTFFPMHIVGLLGMPRRVYTYPEGVGWEIYNLIATIGAFILALGILLFFVNVLYSWRNGPKAGRNPWGGDSLEWATDSPPINYGFRVPPIVRSRHPLWDQAEFDQGDDRTVRLTRALGEWPTHWRAALITTTLDGEPEEIFRVAAPAIWPFFLAVGVVTIFIAEIWRLHWLALFAVLFCIAMIVGWHWPRREPQRDEATDAFEREHGIPVRIEGSYAVGKWGMWLSILLVAIALSTLLFAYFYIRVFNTAWPPTGISMPNLLLGGLAAGLLIAGSAFSYWALRRIRDGDRGQMRLGMAIGSVLGLAALGVQGFDLVSLDYAISQHAYASLYYVLAGVMLLLLLLSVGMSAVTQFWAWQGHFTARHHLSVENTSLFWNAITVSWLIVFGVLYLTPYLS